MVSIASGYTVATPVRSVTTLAVGAAAIRSDGGASTAGSDATSATDQFMAYAKMNPMERIRASVLSGMKLTENDLAGMDPKKRQKIEDTIKEKIKEKLTTDKDQAPGTYLDMKA